MVTRWALVVAAAVCAAGVWGAGGCAVAPLEPSEPIALDAVPFQYAKGGAIKTTLTISEEQWGRVAAKFEPPPAGPAEERARLAAALAELARIAGTQTPTWQDKGRRRGELEGIGHMDCVDASTNTTTYLRLLDERGLMTMHEVMSPTWRYLPPLATHRSAVIREKASGELWAVDPWFKDNGEEPVILPLEVWRSGREDPE